MNQLGFRGFSLVIVGGCDECIREDMEFFQAWRKYRREVSQEEAVEEIGQGFPSQEGGSLARSLMKLVGCESCCCFGTVSLFPDLKKLFPRFGLRPLLSELNMEQDSSWWLIDSGAAVTVVSEAAFGQFQATLKSSPDVERFRAANGSKVSMKGVADISLGFAMKSSKDGRNVWKNASMQVMVGGTHHNILSTTALCRSGWTFTQWADGAELKHDASGNLMLEVVMHSGCPWVRMYPVTSVSQVDFPVGDDSFGGRVEKVVRFEHDVGLAPLSPAVEAQLEMHRKQGHFPHHPQCPECARGRSVFRHRRKAQDAIECEVQADFCFITRRGELNEEDHGRNIKVLVLTEMLSGCVGFIVVNENKAQVQSTIERWLDSFGLMSQQTSIVLHTDDEVSVGELVGRSTKHYVFQLRRAAPQQHRSIGGAERSVRKLKESLAVLRADLNKQGFDIRYSFEGLRDAVTYLALMNNHFGRVGGTNMSPLETSAGRSLAKPTVSLFGSTVIAEIPDSLREYSPNETRSIECCYIHPGLGTGAAVEGLLRVEGRMQLRRFYARNIREMTPLVWKKELCKGLLIPLEGGGPAAAPRVADRENHPVPEPKPVELEDSSLKQGVADDDLFGAESPGYAPTTPPSPRNEDQDLFADEDLDVDKKELPSQGSGAKRSFEGTVDGDVDKRRREQDIDPFFTRGCPSCETGMNAPGIRHTKACQQKRSMIEGGPAVFSST